MSTAKVNVCILISNQIIVNVSLFSFRHSILFMCCIPDVNSHRYEPIYRIARPPYHIWCFPRPIAFQDHTLTLVNLDKMVPYYQSIGGGYLVFQGAQGLLVVELFGNKDRRNQTKISITDPQETKKDS